MIIPILSCERVYHVASHRVVVCLPDWLGFHVFGWLLFVDAVYVLCLQTTILFAYMQYKVGTGKKCFILSNGFFHFSYHLQWKVLDLNGYLRYMTCGAERMRAPSLRFMRHALGRLHRAAPRLTAQNVQSAGMKAAKPALISRAAGFCPSTVVPLFAAWGRWKFWKGLVLERMSSEHHLNC